MPSICRVEELLERNRAEGSPHPRSPQRKGIALKPEQVQLLARSFGDEQARIAFLTFVLTGVRRAELQALRWRDVDLIENVLRVADSKTETGLRAIALTPGLHEELWQHAAARPSRATTTASSATRTAARSTATRR